MSSHTLRDKDSYSQATNFTQPEAPTSAGMCDAAVISSLAQNSHHCWNLHRAGVELNPLKESEVSNHSIMFHLSYQNDIHLCS